MASITGGLGYILPFLVVLTVLVFVHELGHYLAARRNGVRVDVFSIGFGPELFGWTARSGTRWRVGIVPLGGYVRMFGDADAASRPDEGAVEAMSPAEKSVSFYHKRLLQRIEIVAAGPLANFIFSLVVFAGFFMTIGQPFTSSEVSDVLPDSPAAHAGIQPHDVIVAIDGKSVDRFEDIVQTILLNTGTPVEITVRRDGNQVTLHATPELNEEKDMLGNVRRVPRLGIKGQIPAYVQLDPATAVWHAGLETWSRVTSTLEAVGQMIVGRRSSEDAGGPIKIAQMSAEVARGGIFALIDFMAIISINLGLINLFPIPVLDGGHLLFYAAEAIRGRPLGQRAQEFGFRIGLALVLTLMVFVTLNDLGVIAFLKGLVT
ncbi:MAG TPA: RIP metalloprotease RseP [Stellaceae bacterium]|nr:RIP metalloprotease RseP [Stellaceae bacterium]